jgi:hypothetical protein
MYCRQIMKAAEEIVNLVECINHYISAREAVEEPQVFVLADTIETIKSEFKSRLENQKVVLERCRIIFRSSMVTHTCF